MTRIETDTEKLIIGDYYAGAYGPTIFLKALSRNSVEWLRRLFIRLAEDSEAHLDLVAMPEVSIQGVQVLELEQAEEQPDVALCCKSPVAQSAEFQWKQDATSWRRSARLLEPFLAGKVGHQYLTREGQDAAMVEISFGEPAVLGTTQA